MTDIPLPEPIFGFLGPSQSDGRWTEGESGEPAFDANQMHSYAAAVSADENAALRERVKVLEDALHSIAWTRGPGTTSKLVEVLESKALAALEAK
jgi:hypothetical protein